MNIGSVFFLTKWNSSLEQVGKVKKNLSKQVPRELTESGNSRFDLLSVPQQLSLVTGSTLTMKSDATQKLATTGWLDRDDSP